jgi:hypothetical protein
LKTGEYFESNVAITDTIKICCSKFVKKILILSANPKNTEKLRLDEEVREI